MTTKDPSNRRLIERLQSDVSRLQAQVKTLERPATLNESRQSFLAITTCGHEDTPLYPTAPANTFRIAFIDARFDPTPGQRETLYKLRNKPTIKYGATARNISTPGWVPEGVPIIAHWQRCFGGSSNGEWWFQHTGSHFAKGKLSKPLQHDDETAYLQPDATDLDTGLPVVVWEADNTLFHWQGMSGDNIVLRQTSTGWVVWQPQMHAVCAVIDILDSASKDAPDHPGALTKVEVPISTTFGQVPTQVCTVTEFAACGSGSGAAEAFNPPDYAFQYDVASGCCGSGSVQGGSIHSGAGGGSCETGQGMTGVF